MFRDMMLPPTARFKKLNNPDNYALLLQNEANL